MLEKLLNFESDLFLMLNNWHTSFLDNALWLSTGVIIWIPFLLFFIVALVYGKPVKEWLPMVSFMVVVGLLGHLFVAGFFKPFFSRFRPIFHPDFMHNIITYGDYTGGGLYGFISGHSTFVFGLATFTSLVFRYRPYTIVALVWALIIAYSRIYFGVHFLSDIAFGGIVGLVNGVLVYFLYQWYVSRFVYRNRSIDTSKLLTVDIYSLRRKRIIAATLAFYMAAFFVLGGVLVGILH